MDSRFNQEQESLLNEIDRFAKYCLENGKQTDISLTLSQWKLFNKILNLVTKKYIDRKSLVRNLNVDGKTYNGLKVVCLPTARSYTKKDLMELF